MVAIRYQRFSDRFFVLSPLYGYPGGTSTRIPRIPWCLTSTVPGRRWLPRDIRLPTARPARRTGGRRRCSLALSLGPRRRRCGDPEHAQAAVAPELGLPRQTGPVHGHVHLKVPCAGGLPLTDSKTEGNAVNTGNRGLGQTGHRRPHRRLGSFPAGSG